jgi:eukaryotic translation initiation factor 2C
MDLIDKLQTKIAPNDFKPRAVYDGRKNLFAPRELPFGGAISKEVSPAIYRSST